MRRKDIERRLYIEKTKRNLAEMVADLSHEERRLTMLNGELHDQRAHLVNVLSTIAKYVDFDKVQETNNAYQVKRILEVGIEQWHHEFISGDPEAQITNMIKKEHMRQEEE